MTLGKRYLDFFPDWVEAISGNGIDHGNEGLTSRQAGIRLIDEVKRPVMLEDRLFSRSREFHELDVKELVVVICRYRAGFAFTAASLRCSCESHDCGRNEFEVMYFHWVFWVEFVCFPPAKGEMHEWGSGSRKMKRSIVKRDGWRVTSVG